MNTTQSKILTTGIPKDRVLFFGVKAVVVGDFCLKSSISTHTHGFKVTIFIEDGIYKISLLKRVADSDSLKIKNIQNRIYSLFQAPEKEAYSEYIRLLQHIEAIGGFNYGIQKILYHDTLELDWYFGNAVFEDLVRISSAKQTFSRPIPKLLSESNLSSITMLERIMPNAIIPYKFFREAMNFFIQQDYRLAYLHFYMILEFCFISGNNYSEKTQISEYENNIDVKFAILDTLKLYNNNDKNRLDWIVKTVKDRFQQFSLKNILKLLFRIRSEIAHGTNKGAEYMFEEFELHDITKFIASICHTICGNMQVYCEAFTSSKGTRLPQRIAVLENELSFLFKDSNISNTHKA